MTKAPELSAFFAHAQVFSSAIKVPVRNLLRTLVRVAGKEGKVMWCNATSHPGLGMIKRFARRTLKWALVLV